MAKKTKVLVVDDDRRMVRTICDILRVEGYEVERAYSGEEALGKVRDEGPDCVLMDVKMPGAGGVQALKTIRKASPDTPVLLMSANASKEQRVEAKLHGAEILNKPVDFQQILSFLSLLGKKAAMEDAMTHRPRIMTIDDDPRMRKTLADVLRAKGYESVAAGDGEEGLALLADSPVDVVLVDLGLPDVCGLEVLDRVRARHPRTEVIILTGNATLDSAVAATNRGAFSYLLKPYDVEQLLLQVRRAIEKRQAGEELVRHNAELRSINAELQALHEQMKDRTCQLEAANQALAEEIGQRRQAQDEVEFLNWDLQKRTQALEHANRELESFSYTVSHDLRAPLRHMSGYNRMLLEDCGDKLDGQVAAYIDRIEQAGSKMGQLIDALLQLSRLNRAELKLQAVDLSRMAREIVAELREGAPEREVRVEIAAGLSAVADPMLMRSLLQNLLGNAWKYTRDAAPALASFRATEQDGRVVYCVRDNGVGFDMAYVDQVFGAFQRLHGPEYEGSGIGLATVQRVVERHDGRIWAEAAPGKGAAFFFTLGGNRRE